MKFSVVIVSGMLLSAGAWAADDGEESVYASQLCHIVHSEKTTQTAESYVAKIKSGIAGSQSSSALQQPVFDEEKASEVAAAWLQLDDAERSKLRANEQQCTQSVMTQFQQED